ncbi:hypothetical protein [Rathayibacter sp. AY1F3]|nr:hypothetical protein [Rathayibacter sp. AY1F3]
MVAAILLQVAAAAVEPFLPLLGGAIAVLIIVVAIFGTIKLIRIFTRNY